MASGVSERRWQPYRGTLAWLAQRISALALVVLVPTKLYTGYGAAGKLPWLDSRSGLGLHVNTAVDVSLLLFLIVHSLYGLRVMLIDIGWIREDRLFWETASAGGLLFLAAVYFLYLR